MAQYIKHNFAHNYLAYNRYGEEDLAFDLLNDELAKIIVFDKPSIVGVFKANKYKVKKNITRKELVDSVKRYIHKDKKLKKDFASLLMGKENTKTSEGDHIEAVADEFGFIAGGELTKRQGVKKQKKKGLLDNLISDGTIHKSIYHSFDSDSSTKDLAEKVESHYINKKTMEGKVFTDKEVKKKVRYTAIKTFLATSGVIIGGFFAIRFLATKYGHLMGLNSGDVNFDEPTKFEQGGGTPQPQTQDLSGLDSGDGYDEFGFKQE